MTADQMILFTLFGLVFVMLIWGRFRYDLVAFSALIAGVVSGVVPTEESFSGFGHPATLVVALVLIISAGLVRSGAVSDSGKVWLAIGIFGMAVAAASFGFLYLPVALGIVVVAYVLTGILSLSNLYGHVEWPVIVLLGSKIPLGAALDNAGGTALIANTLVTLTDGWPAWAVLTVLMIVTMTLSGILNNTATAIVAAPVGIQMAQSIGVSTDPFLMAVAVAASCAFLTPIGHKNNTLILGPGGYAFGDYWQMGLPLEIIVVAVSIPMILLVWPM